MLRHTPIDLFSKPRADTESPLSICSGTKEYHRRSFGPVKVIERLTASGIWRNSIRLKPLFYRFLGGSVDIEQIDRGDRTNIERRLRAFLS